MRLLNIHTLEFGEFSEKHVPEYWILSHRWGDNEVSYKEFRKGLNQEGSGYKKIVRFCDLIRRTQTDPLRYPVDWAWVDTCCIDKRSSAELSEAINSMFSWYSKAQTCVTFLEDFDRTQDLARLEKSSWFSRGWTLQELLAPEMIMFCDARWEVFGHICKLLRARNLPCGCAHYSQRPEISAEVSEITGIHWDALTHSRSLEKYSIAQRMSWAARRQTTRLEDEAYCLLGIFDINMPLLYGEGRKAFRRLQEEIIRSSTDQSLFVWTLDVRTNLPMYDGLGLLAPSVAYFQNMQDVVDSSIATSAAYSITNNGLELWANLTIIRPKRFGQPHLPQHRRYLSWKLNCARPSKGNCDQDDSAFDNISRAEIALCYDEELGRYHRVDVRYVKECRDVWEAMPGLPPRNPITNDASIYVSLYC